MAQGAQRHHLSGATTAAATTYNEAVRAFNLVHGDAIGLFDEARQPDPVNRPGFPGGYLV